MRQKVSRQRRTLVREPVGGDHRVDDRFESDGARARYLAPRPLCGARRVFDEDYRCCQGINFNFYSGGGYGSPREFWFELVYEYGGI